MLQAEEQNNELKYILKFSKTEVVMHLFSHCQLIDMLSLITAAKGFQRLFPTWIVELALSWSPLCFFKSFLLISVCYIAHPGRFLANIMLIWKWLIKILTAIHMAPPAKCKHDAIVISNMLACINAYSAKMFPFLYQCFIWIKSVLIFK